MCTCPYKKMLMRKEGEADKGRFLLPTSLHPLELPAIPVERRPHSTMAQDAHFVFNCGTPVTGRDFHFDVKATGNGALN
jgi:hypothetical protein